MTGHSGREQIRNRDAGCGRNEDSLEQRFVATERQALDALRLRPWKSPPESPQIGSLRQRDRDDHSGITTAEADFRNWRRRLSRLSRDLAVQITVQVRAESVRTGRILFS